MQGTHKPFPYATNRICIIIIHSCSSFTISSVYVGPTLVYLSTVKTDQSKTFNVHWVTLWFQLAMHKTQSAPPPPHTHTHTHWKLNEKRKKDEGKKFKKKIKKKKSQRVIIDSNGQLRDNYMPSEILTKLNKNYEKPGNRWTLFVVKLLIWGSIVCRLRSCSHRKKNLENCYVLVKGSHIPRSFGT